MPKFLEDRLKHEYGANSDVPYKILNAKGYMRGSKETAKGRALDRRHAQDRSADRSSSARRRSYRA